MRRLAGEAGFTLVELLIAVALTGVVSLAVFQLFSTQERAFSIQDQVGEMQQNVRVTMEMITRDARMAGYKISASFAIAVYNNVAGGNVVDGGGVTVGTNSKPATDAVTFSYVDGNSPSYSVNTPGGSMTAANFTICVEDAYITGNNINASFPYQVGTVVGVYSTGGFQFIQITQTSTPGGPGCNAGYTKVKMNFSSGQSPINLPGGIDDVCNGNCNNPQPILAEMITRTYFVDNTNQLMVSQPVAGGGYNPQPLAENIEDLQLHYFLSGGGESDAPTTAQIANIQQIRVNVLGRTARQDDRVANFTQTAIEDGVAQGPDGYRRRLLTSRVKVRNLGL